MCVCVCVCVFCVAEHGKLDMKLSGMGGERFCVFVCLCVGVFVCVEMKKKRVGERTHLDLVGLNHRRITPKP